MSSLNILGSKIDGRSALGQTRNAVQTLLKPDVFRINQKKITTYLLYQIKMQLLSSSLLLFGDCLSLPMFRGASGADEAAENALGRVVASRSLVPEPHSLVSLLTRQSVSPLSVARIAHQSGGFPSSSTFAHAGTSKVDLLGLSSMKITKDDTAQAINVLKGKNHHSLVNPGTQSELSQVQRRLLATTESYKKMVKLITWKVNYMRLRGKVVSAGLESDLKRLQTGPQLDLSEAYLVLNNILKENYQSVLKGEGISPMVLVGEYHKVVDEMVNKMKEVKNVPKDIQREIDMVLKEDVYYDLSKITSYLTLFDESVMQKVAATRKAYEDLVDKTLQVLTVKKASGARIPENFEAELIRSRSNPNFDLDNARFALEQVESGKFEFARIVLGKDAGNFRLLGFIRKYDKLAIDARAQAEQPLVGQDFKSKVNEMLNSKVYDYELLKDVYYGRV